MIATGPMGSDTLLLSNFITVYPFPAPQGISKSGDTLSALPGATSYQWYYNGSIIPGATNYFYVASQSGDYNVVATDYNGCEVEAVINDVIAGLTPPLSKGEGSGVRSYPNPVQDKLYVTCYKPALLGGAAAGLTGTAIDISIYNVLAEKIYSADYPDPSNENPIIIGCEHFPSGVYYLELVSNNNLYRIKFMKQ
jgi:hypothetical protein